MAKPLKKPVQKSSMSRFWSTREAEEALAPQDESAAPAEKPLRVVESAKEVVMDPILETRLIAPAITVTTRPQIQEKPKLTVVKERLDAFDLKMTPLSRQILDELVNYGKQSINRSLTPTQILRAMLISLETRMPQVRAELEALGPQKMPSTESRFAAEREEFEKRLAEAIINAVRR